ncbi:MAG: type pilus assembly protein PilC [Acidobacteriota bacterium]|nr:type pilus assembly protein PilC [Acidobacteriota bacterium]
MDIGASSVKAVELSGKNDRLTLTGLGVEPLARGTIEEGQSLDHTEFSRAISKLFGDHHLTTQNIASGVSGNSVILKTIEVPPMSEEELRESIDWHAEEHCPFDMSDVRLGYQVIDSDEYSIKVLIAICKTIRVENLEHTLQLAGKRADIIDCCALALQNCYTFNYQPSDDSLVALVHIGASLMIIHIMKGNRLAFTHDASMGGDQYTEQISRELGLTFEQAEAAKLGLADELETVGTEINEVIEVIAKRLALEGDFEKLTEATTENLALEIQKSLDFYSAISTDEETSIGKILISGGGSRLKGLRETLSHRLMIPVEPLDPFRRIKYDERRFSPERLSEVESEMAVAVGLALRGSDAQLLAVNLSASAAEKKLVGALPVKDARKKKKEKIFNRHYHYKGRNRIGELIAGERIAESSEALRMLLRREQIILTSFREEQPESSLFASGAGRKKVSLRDLVSFTGWFSYMVEAGIPLISSLEVLAQEQKNRYFKQVLDQVISDVGQGSTLASAMKHHPEVFDEFYVNMVEAGETGGIVDRVLSRLHTALEKSISLRRKIWLAILYPLSALALVSVILMLSITAALHNAQGNAGGLNWYLRFWASVGAATASFLGSAGGVIFLAVVVAALLALGVYSKTSRGHRQRDALLLRLPFVGPLLRKHATARFGRILATLLSSGVPILASLDITAKMVGNLVFAEAIEKIRSGVERGETFSAPMTEVFPTIVSVSVEIGEQTGCLDASLGKIADFYEDEVNRAVSRLPLIILPLLIILLVLIGIIAVFR